MADIDLTGRVVAVTGGAQGIGLATARRLHRAGAVVAVADIDTAALASAADDPAVSLARPLDVTDAGEFAGFLDAVESALGPLDVLVNNAAVCPAGSFLDEDDEVTARTLAVNTTAVIVGSRLAARRMRDRGHGHVVNVASLGGIVPMRGVATYCASKFAVVGFTDTARLELRGTGVLFSCVLPGVTNTRMIDGLGRTWMSQGCDPDVIAEQIVGVIARPVARRAAPRLVGSVAELTSRLLPRRVAEAVNRAVRADGIFSDGLDPSSRRAYEDAIRRT